jgi:hypothetical protein
MQAAMKHRLDVEPEWSAKRAYYSELNEPSVTDATVAPTLSSVERSLQRHKVKHRPPLPAASRQDLVFPANLVLTTDGRPFKLIDDGLVERLIVFGTDQQLIRRVKNL